MGSPFIPYNGNKASPPTTDKLESLGEDEELANSKAIREYIMQARPVNTKKN
ncbi:MAG: hypothetical protein WBQ16_04255 [Nitrososphaeraceae archaeon]